MMLWNPWRLPKMFSDLDEEGWDLSAFDENELDLYETQESVIIKVKAPGFEPDDVDITVEGGQVCVTGKVEEEEEEKGKDKDKKYYRKEIRTRSFTRSVTLPVAVKADQAEAEFEKGILTLTIPKAEEAKPKQIKVKTKEK